MTAVTLSISLLTPALAQNPVDGNAIIAAPDTYAITNARIIPSAGKVIDKGTLVLRDGFIVAVGDSVTVPKDAQVIDGTGLTVYPALTDAFTTAGMPEAADYPRPDRGALYPVATVRSDIDAPSLLKPDAAWAAHRKNGFATGLIAPKVGLLAGSSALVSFAMDADNPSSLVMKSPVAVHASWNNPRPSGADDYPESLMGKIAVLRQALYDALDADMRLNDYAKNPAGKPRPVVSKPILALIPVVEKREPLVIYADTARSIRRGLKLAKEFGLTPVIEGGEDAGSVAGELKVAGASVLLTAALPAPPEVPAGEEDPSTLQSLRYRATVPKTAAKLAVAGVPFAFSTEGLANIDDYRKNVRKMIAAGLSPDAATEAATSATAKLWGTEKLSGTLAPGLAGNVLVTDGDLWGAKTKIRYLFVDGKKTEAGEPASAPKPSPSPSPDGDIADDKAPKKDPDTVAAPPETGEGPVFPLPPQLPAAFVLRDATVWTVGPQGTLPDADVYVRDGKIAAVGAHLSVPAGTTEVDAKGKQITPGIVDCHSHTAIDGGVNEGTNIVTSECRIEDVIDPEDVNIYRQLAGGTTAANVLHGSANAIGGQNCVVKWRWGKTAEEMKLAGAPPGLKWALGENPKQSNWEPAIPRYPQTRMGVEKVLRESLTKARDYQDAWKAYRDHKTALPPRRDLQLDALVEVLEGKRLVHCHSYRQDEILATMRVAEEFGFRIGSFQHVMEGYKIADEMVKHGVGGSTFSDWWAYKIEVRDAIPYNGALMDQRGVVVSFNSDDNELARRLSYEAAKAVHWGGLAPEEAIKFVTINPAKQLQIDKMVGSLEPGKDADIAVWNGDPLSSLSRCDKTFVDGKLYFDRAADLAARPALEAEFKRLAEAEKADDKPSRKDVASAPPAATPLATAVAAAVAPASLNSGGPITAITGGTVHPVSGPSIPNGVVVMQGGVILAVGAAGSVTIPAGAKAIDATGEQIYPGFFDADTQLGLSEIDSISATIDSREMGDFNPELRTAIAVNPDSDLIPEARANGVLSVVTAPEGGTISGQGAVLNLAGWTWEDLAVNPSSGEYLTFPHTAVRRFRETGDVETETAGVPADASNALFRSGAYVPADPMTMRLGILPPALGAPQAPAPPPGAPPTGRRRFGGPSADSGESEEDKLRKILQPLNDFVASAKRYRMAKEAGTLVHTETKWEAMLPVLAGTEPFYIRADRESDIRAAVKWARTNGFSMVLLGGEEADKCADFLASEKVPVILGPVMRLPRKADAPYDDGYTIPAKLAKAGVSFCLSTGSSSDIRRLPWQAAIAAAFGLDHDEAIRAITLAPAQITGRGNCQGSLEVGKDATLIVTNGDPLEIKTTVQAAFIKGQPVDLTTRQKQLYERYLARPKKS